MKSYILEHCDRMPFFTDMRVVFEALRGRQTDYNWLITDLEHYSDALDKGTVWIDGGELTKIIYGNQIQWVWGVFSGFRKDIEINPAKLRVEPYADGNPNFWIAEPAIQHPLAEIEIVCWDSSLTLFLSKNEELSKYFREYFKESTDLKIFNKKYI